ncbi:proton-conducting transporter transmembrane domain-containing protein [Psychroflexus aestuariivivens]|uniref:proton-conducting transporter transmembrane domain-containing protein n=1 Tax=Psychroflexus aestuariivivens TaxID=1795040 RepID=UPI000FD73275|nr:proton-conducting transporter membrane subunit [Psychroflexus aestuariivivens]
MNSTIALQHNKSQNVKTDIPWISRLINPILWIFFFISIGGIGIYFVEDATTWTLGTYFRINGLSLAIFSTVSFFGALISTYAKRYLQGFKFQKVFSLYSLGFISSVLLFVISNHVGLVIASWFFMGLFMSKLIGVNSDWGEARAASNYALRFFVASSLLLSLSLGLLAYYSDALFLNVIFENLSSLPYSVLLSAALLLILAGLIQSALFPFHRWLLSAMTAPTPASALMHAGFINGAGILFTIFASVLIASNTLTLLFILGGFTAIFAQFVKLLQVNVKHKLACSTIAQMGFMVMQCGLGFFNAAIVHLILHGFYKAYLFLSSGEEVEMRSPEQALKIKIKALQAFIVLIFGVLGAGLFMLLTNKTSLTDSSIFLTLIIAITVGQATYNIIKAKIYSYGQRLMLSAALFIIGIGMYALIYNAVSLLLIELNYAIVPQKLTAIEIAFGMLFLLGFFLMKLGIYRKTPWLYVKLLNLTQPHKHTVLKFKK